MQIAVPHHTTKAKARSRVDEKLSALLAQFGGQADDVQHDWNGDVLTFKGKAKGFVISGTVEVTETEIVIDGKLPLMARPFEPRIKEAVKREADAMFRTA